MRSLLLLLVLSACARDVVDDTHAPCTTCTPDALTQPICSLCTADSDCASGICRMYGDGYRKCSTTCAVGQAAPQCATMTEAGACNGMGFCGCPFYEPPRDAGVDGGFYDASMGVNHDDHGVVSATEP